METKNKKKEIRYHILPLSLSPPSPSLTLFPSPSFSSFVSSFSSLPLSSPLSPLSLSPLSPLCCYLLISHTHTDKEYGPGLQTRNRAFSEILKTERNFVFNLQIIVKEYLKTLREQVCYLIFI